MKGMVKVLMVAVLAVGNAGVASCAKKPEPFSCSSADAMSVTGKLVMEQVEKATVALWKSSDSPAGVSESSIRASVALLKVTVIDVRTTKKDPSSTKNFCAGTAKVVLPLNVIEDADKARALAHVSSVTQYAEGSEIQRDADTFSFPIEYAVQPTDDKKSTFAESATLSGPVNFFAELLYDYLSKNQLQNQATAQEQQAKEQEKLLQQSRQAGLETAQAENKLSTQTINAVWNEIDPYRRSELLDLQRAWIKQKTADCKIQAAGASTDPTEQEATRLKCDTAANLQRTEWLRQYLGG